MYKGPGTSANGWPILGISSYTCNVSTKSFSLGLSLDDRDSTKLMNILTYGGGGLYNLLELACTRQGLRDDLPRRDLDGPILTFSWEEDDAVDEVNLPVTLQEEGSVERSGGVREARWE